MDGPEGPGLPVPLARRLRRWGARAARVEVRVSDLAARLGSLVLAGLIWIPALLVAAAFFEAAWRGPGSAVELWTAVIAAGAAAAYGAPWLVRTTGVLLRATAEGTGEPGRDRLPRGGLHGGAFRVMRVSGRRAGVLEVQLDTAAFPTGGRVEVSARLRYRWDQGFVGSRHPTFRGPGGEFVVRYLSEPIRPEDALELTVALPFPLRALVIPEAGGILSGDAVVEARSDGGPVVARHRFGWEFAPLSEDRAPLVDPAAAARAAGAGGDEFRVVAAGAGTAAICLVCGDPIDAHPLRCGLCDTPHHPECWRYVGRCTTYGCGGGAG